MKRLFAVLLLLCAFSGATFGATKTSTGNGGLWSASATWSAAGEPAATDDVICATGNSIIFDAAAACAGGTACFRTLVIQTGCSITFGRGTNLTMFANCSTTTEPCIDLSGTLSLGPGNALRIGSDYAADDSGNDDVIFARSGGRLTAKGRVLRTGTITSVITDEADVSNPSQAFGLPTRDFEFEDTSAEFAVSTAGAAVWVNSAATCTDNCYIVRFLTGERAGRWYNTKAPASLPSTRMGVFFNSRFNPAGTSGNVGAGLTATTVSNGYGSAYTTGTACYAATAGGACADAGQFVTGTGTTWTTAMANGSRFYCDVDGPSHANSARVLRRISNTQLMLDRVITATATNCDSGGADAYHLVDDNQPFPFEDHSEHIRPGDKYEIVLPATISGAVITTGAEPDQTSLTPHTAIKCLPGSACDFDRAVFKWIGRGSTSDGAGIFFQRMTPALTNSEIANFYGDGGITIDGCTSPVVTGNFIHHQTLAGSSIANRHAMLMDSSDNPATITTNPVIANNRWDLIGDDALWDFGYDTNLKLTDNIVKYVGSRVDVDTANGFEITGIGAGTTNSTAYKHFNALVAGNLFSNIGGAVSTTETIGGGQGAAIEWKSETGKIAQIAVTRNRIMNNQTASGIAYGGETNGTETDADYAASQISVVGNYISDVGLEGIAGVHTAIGNIVKNYGLDRSVTQMSGIVQVTNALKGNLVVAVDEDLTTTGLYGASAFRPGVRECFNADCNTVSTTAFRYAPTTTISDNAIFGGGPGVVFGGTAGGGTGMCGSCAGSCITFQIATGVPDFRFTNNLIDCSTARPNSGNNTGLDMWVNQESGGDDIVTATQNIIMGCTSGNINKRGCQTGTCVGNVCTAPANIAGTACTAANNECLQNPAESNNALLGSPLLVTGSGFTIAASDVKSMNTTMVPQAYIYDRSHDITGTTIGPRAMGLLSYEGWYKRDDLLGLSALTAASNKDTDLDGIIDLFDNCPKKYNPMQTDSDGNGVGDDCQ